MENGLSQKMKLAKLLGCLYFLLLGLINFGATPYYSSIHAIDFTILLLGCLPIIVNRKEFNLFYGIIAALISLYMFVAALNFNLSPEIKTTQLAFNMGYLLQFSMIICSCLLVFTGANPVPSHRDEILTGK